MATNRKTGTTAPRKTSSVFTSHVQQRDLTRERIVEDIEAFSKAGGKIEILGNTPFRKKPEGTPPGAPDKSTKPAAGKSGKA